MPVAGLTEKPSLDTVRSVIDTVFSTDSNVDRKQATDWLDALKLSVYAWEICDQLLAANLSFQVSGIAANILRNKISTSFNELPLEYYSSLKDSILNHLLNHEDYVVQGQLIAVVADLTLLLAQWANPIEDLAISLKLSDSLATCDRLKHEDIKNSLNRRLIFASIIHQMCDLNHNHSERPCKIGANRREQYEDYLISKCAQCVDWWIATIKECSSLKKDYIGINLPNHYTAISENIKLIEKLIGQIYLCYSAWLRIFDEENVVNSMPLLSASFDDLKNHDCSEELHTRAVEVVISTANFCEDSTKVDYLTDHLVSKINELRDAFQISVTNEELEKSNGYVRIFTSIAITACKSHVINKNDFSLVELLLSCLNHYDFDIVEETFTFWYSLIENVQNCLSPVDYPKYINYIHKFIIAITHLCQCDPDADSIISKDYDLERFRSTAVEVILNVMYVTNVSEFIQSNDLLKHLQLDLRMGTWENVEAILFLFSALVQIMTEDDEKYKKELITGMIMQQTFENDLNSLLSNKQVNLKIGTRSGEIHPQIVATSLKILSNVNDFLESNDDYLVLCTNYILASIHNPKDRTLLLKDAAGALCGIVQTKASCHFANNPDLLNILRNLCNDLDQFDVQAAAVLLKCCSSLSNSVQDLNMREQFLGQLLQPNINLLAKFLVVSGDDDIDKLIDYLDRLSVIFQNTKLNSDEISRMQNLVSLIDTQIWPTLIKVLEKFAGLNESVIEKCCRTTRYMLRCISPKWLIQSVAETMVNLYQRYPQNSSPLYVCSILVDEFANLDPEINKGLFNVLDAFCSMTFNLLDINGPQAKSLLSMKTYPETIEDMMRLFNRFMKKCPSEFVSCKAIQSIIQLSISSLRIDHQDANNTVCKFLTSFIQLGTVHNNHQSKDQNTHDTKHDRQYYPGIHEAIANVLGANIVDAVIKACLFQLPPSLIADEAGILMMLSYFDKELFKKWIKETVLSLPTTNIQGIVSIKPEQLDEFRETLSNATTQKRMVNCLRAFANMYS